MSLLGLKNTLDGLARASGVVRAMCGVKMIEKRS